MNDMREEISETRKKVKAAHAAIQALCNRERFLMSIPANRKTDHDLILSDALLALDADLEIAEAANREKDAEIARLKEEVKMWKHMVEDSAEHQLAVSEGALHARQGKPMNPSYSASGKLNYSYQSAYEDVQHRMSDEAELSSLRASVGEKDVEIARLRAEKLEAGELMSRVAAASGKQGALKSKLERAEADLIEMTNDRDLWQEAHDEDCPNKAMLASLRASVGEKWIEVKEGCPVPEYGDMIQAICTSGNMEPWQEIFESIFTMGWEEMRACGVTHYKTLDWPLPAPPSTEKES
jgi:hypothetical protein